MAELTVKGFAKKEVLCDWVQYIFTFEKEAKTSAEGIEAVNQEIEKFLGIMENAGVNPEEFVTGTMSSRKKYSVDDDDEFPYEACKSIYFYTELKLENSNAILQIISDNKIDVRYSEDHNPRNVEQVHRELLKMAMEDSKAKAEMIAACAGKKVIGIVKVDANIKEHEEIRSSEIERGIHYIRTVPMKADKLRLDTVEESEEVEVVWLIES